jgi:uncharacterized protein involved in outer membrane biogenesis
MKRFIKYFLIILFAILAVAITLPFFVSIENLKAPIIASVKKITGRELAINGKLSLSLLPQPRVIVGDIKFGSINGTKSPYLLEAEEISANIALLPLLSGKVEISNLRIAKPQINLEILPDGKANWDIASKENKIEAAAPTKTGHAEANLPFKDIYLANGKIRYFNSSNSLEIEQIDAYVDLSKNTPHIKLTAAAKEINLDKWLDNKTSMGVRALSNNTQPNIPWAKTKIDLAFLNDFSGDFSLKIKQLNRQDMILTNLDTKLLLNNGELSVNRFAATVFGGDLKAQGKISSTAKQSISLDISMHNAQLHRIAPKHKQFKITEGLLNFTGKFNTSGASQYEYVNNLSGNLQFDTKNGKLHGIDLQKTLAALDNIKGAEGLLNLLNSSFAEGSTEFSKLAGKGEIKQGIIQLISMEVAARRINALAKGIINLPGYNLDIDATINADVKKIPEIKVKFFGSLNSIQHKLDTKAIKQRIGETVLDAVIDSAKEGNIKPKDLLKSIENKLFN